MTNPDYFFFILLGAIAVSRLFGVAKIKAPTIGGFRVHHHMYGFILLIPSFLLPSLTLYAISLGLIVDELPVILRKGLVYKDENCEDYRSAWCVAGVFVLVLLIFFFRGTLSGLA